MNILITNAYSAANRGDAAIIVAMIELIRGCWPSAEITVMSSYWKENERFYSKLGARSVPPPWILRKGHGAILRYMEGVRNVWALVVRPLDRRFQDFHRADLVLAAGGGYLYSSAKGPLGVGLLNSLFSFVVARRLRKKSLAFPQSVGPLNSRLDRWLTGVVLRRVDIFCSREQDTTNLLESLGVRPKRCIDVAFGLEAASSPANVTDDGITVGVTVLDWRFADAQSEWKDIEAYVREVAAGVNLALDANPTLHIDVVTQVNVSESDTDLHCSELLASLLPPARTRHTVFSPETGVQEILDHYGSMRCFVGSRLHSAILALSAHVPTICLSYQPKGVGTFKALELDRWVRDVRKVSAEWLADSINGCLAGLQPSIDPHRQRNVEVLRTLLQAAELGRT